MSDIASPLSAADENLRLQRCLRDLAALTALPALWDGCDCRTVIDSLADALTGMLDLDFIYIAIAGLSTQPGLRVCRARNRVPSDRDAETIERCHEAARNRAGVELASFPDPWDGVETSVSVLPFKVDGFDSLLIAGKRHPRFPDKTDQLLLRTGINQATLHLKKVDAENALKDKSNEFDLVLSSITDFAYSFDVEGRVKFANKALLDTWQMSLEQARGRTFGDLHLDPSAAAKLQSQIRQVATTKTPLMDEMPYTGPSGGTGYYQYIFAPQLGRDGSVLGIVGTGRDVSALRQGEARDRFLVQLDSVLRPLTDPAEMTLAAATMLGRYLHVDRCAYADIEEDQDTMNLSGNYLRAPEIHSIVGQMKFRDFGAQVLQLMRDDKPYVVNDIDTHVPPVENKDAYRATQIQAVICVPLHKNGRFVAAMAVHQATPRQWTQKEVELVLNVASRCWESIERSRIERELARKYASLFMQTPIAICVLEGPNYIFRLANPSYLALVSAEDRNVIDQTLFEALPELRDQGFEQLLDQVYKSGKPYFGKEVVVRFRHDNDVKQRYVDFIYQPRFNSKGVVDGILVVAGDVTEKVEARLNLEAADRRKDEFLATLAHELRNPLAPIKNSLEIMRNIDDKDRIARLRDIMDAQLTHLIRLVDDLLDMSRINEGKIELRKERLTLQSVIQTAIEACRWQFAEERHALEVNLPDAPIRVAADATRLTQVISNLLNNAGKYTPRGGRVMLSAARDGAMATITVTDNGIGIPPDMTDRIFEPFTQVEHSKQRSQGGMGIGLALVKRLVEMHGGFVSVTSGGTDQGSTFTVGIPLADEPVPADPVDAQAGQEAVLPNLAPASVTGLRVLVVDDNVDSAQTIGWMLETKRHEAVLAYSGKQALELAFEQQPDVILLDLGLPDISGYEVCRTLRKAPEFRDTLIVAQTGWGQKRDRDMSQAAGFDQHLVKPIGIDDIATLLAGRFGANGDISRAPIASGGGVD